MKDNLAIIGSHPRTRTQFDFERTDCDIWLFNEALSNKSNTWAKRADAVFQLHVPTIWKNPHNRNDAGHYDWLKSQSDTVVFMQDDYIEVPMSEKYPLDEIKSLVGDAVNHFLSSSVALALALACLRKYKVIDVYGVAMESNTEYIFQREGVAFWMGFAKGLGIKLVFHDDTFACPIYGYEGDVSIKYEKIVERIDLLSIESQKIAAGYSANRNAMINALTNFSNNGNQQAEQTLFESVELIKKHAETLGLLDGAIQENTRYKLKADAMKKATSDFTFSRQEFESSAQNMSKKVGDAENNIIVIGAQLDIIHKDMKGSAKASPKRTKLLEQYKALLQQYTEEINRSGLYRGAMNENFAYMSELEKKIRAAGGAKSEAVLLEAQNA